MACPYCTIRLSKINSGNARGGFGKSFVFEKSLRQNIVLAFDCWKTFFRMAALISTRPQGVSRASDPRNGGRVIGAQLHGKVLTDWLFIITKNCTAVNHFFY